MQLYGVSAFRGSGSCRRAGRVFCIRSDDGLQVCRVHPVPDRLQVRRVFWFRSRFLSSGRARGTISAAVSADEHLFGLHIFGPEMGSCRSRTFVRYPQVMACLCEHLFGTSVRFVGSNEHLFWLTIGSALSNICSDRPSAPTRSHRPSVVIGSGIGFPDRPSAADWFGSGSEAL